MDKRTYFEEQKNISQKVDEYVLDFIEKKLSNLLYKEPILYGIKKRFNKNPKMRGYFGYLLYNLLAEKDNYKPILPILGSYELYALSTYSLDDLLDNQPKRAGELSSYAKFGINDTIISGIIQRDLAFEMLKELDVKPEIKLKIYETFEEGDKILYYGQLLNEHMKQGTTLEDYLEVRKLISFECKFYPNIIGHFVSNKIEKEDKKEDIIRKSKNLGEYLGLVGMIGNDFMSFIPEKLEIKRSKSQSGKSYEDIRKGLWTFPFIHYFSQDREESEKKFVRSILGNPEASDEDMYKIIQVLINSGSLEEHLHLLEKIKKECISYIEGNFPESSNRDRLISFFDYYVDLGARYKALKKNILKI